MTSSSDDDSEGGDREDLKKIWVIHNNILVIICKHFHFGNAQTCHLYK